MLSEGIFTERKFSSSFAFSQCQFTAQFVKAEVVLFVICLMDRKGEPLTLEQQFELRLYTDHLLKPVSQNFPNHWFLIIWRLTSCQFPKGRSRITSSQKMYRGKNPAKCWRHFFAYFMYRNKSM